MRFNQSAIKKVGCSFSFLLLLNTSSLFAEEAKWEFGLGIGHLNAPAYLGSNEQLSLTTPVPFIKVQTDWFDMSKGSLQMKWFDNTPFRLSFNFDVGLPVESEKVKAREGMADLAAVLQVGPMLSYQFTENPAMNWKLELPLMLASSVDATDAQSLGWTFAPRLAMIFVNQQTNQPFDLEISAGPVFGESDYHQYYYSVDSADATPTRALYSAESGYAGYRLNVSMTTRIDEIWVGAYLRYHNLSNASFSDSPLVDDKEYWLVTFAVSWVFAGNMK